MLKLIKGNIMKSMNTEFKKVVSRVKEAQVQLQGLIKSQDWIEEAKKYAERQSKEVKKLLLVCHIFSASSNTLIHCILNSLFQFFRLLSLCFPSDV